MVVIEHFHPRSGSPRTGKWKSSQCRAASGATSHESSRTAWSNLLLSCDGSGPHGARTCDSKKGGSDICSRFANPKTTHLDRLVDIGRDGRARPVDSLPPGADAVVDSELNLNAEFLCEARRSYFAVQLREYNKAKTRHRGLSSVQKQILVNRFRERASRPGTPHPSVLLAVANSIEAKI
ncbi:hypothetical protein [Gordonia malaquae]|nr:hypothetical protein [Gordonia malaquae]